MTVAEAKQLFLAYNGSVFYMSRDGRDEEYLAAKIDRKTEQLWLRELADRTLTGLEAKGNWKVIHFFNHHQDYE